MSSDDFDLVEKEFLLEDEQGIVWYIDIYGKISIDKIETSYIQLIRGDLQKMVASLAQSAEGYMCKAEDLSE